MIKKILIVASIFGFIFIGNHTDLIEDIFNLSYCFGQCIPSYLLGIVSISLLVRNSENR